MIGSEHWLRDAERQWRRFHLNSFDPAKAFRSACLKEVASFKPRSWNGVPWVLHSRYDRSGLHPRFVAYLDRHMELRDWRMLMRELQHQPLQWWADRLAELDGLER